QLARLLSAVRDEDPGLRDTVIVVTADLGEELGEDGRIEHPASLADGVQHVPWIVAGGPVEPGRRCTGVTEHVDVVPTLLALLGLPLPSDVTAHGRAWFDAPARSFVVRADFWRTTDAARVRCVRVDESTDRSALGADGWMWSGRGVTARGAEGRPLSVRLEVPAGVYAVDAAGTPIAAPPWLFGFGRWRRKAFLPDVPSEFPPLGTLDASGRELALELPA